MLLFLRLPFLGGLTTYLNDRPAWLGPVFELGTYLLTLILVVWHSDSLTEFHVDIVAVALILLAKPIETLYLSTAAFRQLPLAFPRWPSLLIWILAVGAAAVLLARRRHLPRYSAKAMYRALLGLAIGVAGAFLLGLIMSFRSGTITSSRNLPYAFRQAVIWIPYQVGYAGVSEKPLFRAFLWGQLRRHRWRDGWILLLQTLLFMAGHCYYIISSPISFWVTVPIGGIGLGLIAWRTRTISCSLLAHGSVNAISGAAEMLFRTLTR